MWQAPELLLKPSWCSSRSLVLASWSRTCVPISGSIVPNEGRVKMFFTTRMAPLPMLLFNSEKIRPSNGQKRLAIQHVASRMSLNATILNQSVASIRSI